MKQNPNKKLLGLKDKLLVFQPNQESCFILIDSKIRPNSESTSHVKLLRWPHKVHSSAWNKVQFRVHCLRHYVTDGYIDGYISTDLQKIHLAPATQDKFFVHILKPVNVFNTEKSENRNRFPQVFILQ